MFADLREVVILMPPYQSMDEVYDEAGRNEQKTMEIQKEWKELEKDEEKLYRRMAGIVIEEDETQAQPQSE